MICTCMLLSVLSTNKAKIFSLYLPTEKVHPGQVSTQKCLSLKGPKFAIQHHTVQVWNLNLYLVCKFVTFTQDP